MTNTYKKGQSDVRPWGCWQVTDCGQFFCTKHIFVDLGKELSLQSHKYRKEYWVIVRGTASVTLGDEVLSKKAGEMVYISEGTKHRIKNIGNEKLEFVEVQFGENLDEDDIVRYEDAYGRV